MQLQALPSHISRFFWGDDMRELHPQKHAQYITQTLLEKGDRDAISWLFDTIGVKRIIEMLPSLKLSQKSAHFWKGYFA